MSLARPILRDPRQVTLDASPGQILFTLTPTTPVLAVEDLVVETRVAPATGFTRRLDGFSVTLVDGGARVLFATPPRPAVADPVCTVRLTSRRTHERAADVTRGGAISSASLEEELDRQTLVLQELRRDADDNAARVDSVQAWADIAQEAGAAAAPIAAAAVALQAQVDDVASALADAQAAQAAAIAAPALAAASAATATAARDAAAAAAATAGASAAAAALGPAVAQAFRPCFAASPQHRDPLDYLVGVLPSGARCVLTMAQADGDGVDYRRTVAGRPATFLGARPCFAPSPTLIAAAYEVDGVTASVQATVRADGVRAPVAGVANPLADAEMEASAHAHGGDIVVETAAAAFRIASGDALDATPVATRPGRYYIARDLPLRGEDMNLLADLRGATALSPITAGPRHGKTLWGVVTIGQSNAARSHATQILDPYYSASGFKLWMLANSVRTNTPDERCACYRGNPQSAQRIRLADLSGLIPYVAANGPGTVHGLGSWGVTLYHLAKAMRAAFGDEPEFLIGSIGLGSVPFDYWLNAPTSLIAPTLAPYGDIGDTWRLRDDFDAWVKGGQAAAAARGMAFAVLIVDVLGGEALTSDPATLQTVIAEINADLVTPGSPCHTSQQGAPFWFGSTPARIVDVSSDWTTANTLNGVKAYDLADSAGKMCVVAPGYATVFEAGLSDDATHYNSIGQMVIGEYRSFALGRFLLGERFRPLRFDLAGRVGDVVTLTAQGGTGAALMVDTRVADRAGTLKGFRVFTGSAATPATVVSQAPLAVTISGRTVTVTLPAGATGTLGYADAGQTVYPGQDPAMTALGPICEPGFSAQHDGRTLRHFALQRQWSL